MLFHYCSEIALAYSLVFGAPNWARITKRGHEKRLARISLIAQQDARYDMPLIHYSYTAAVKYSVVVCGPRLACHDIKKLELWFSDSLTKNV